MESADDSEAMEVDENMQGADEGDDNASVSQSSETLHSASPEKVPLLPPVKTSKPFVLHDYREHKTILPQKHQYKFNLHKLFIGSLEMNIGQNPLYVGYNDEGDSDARLYFSPDCGNVHVLISIHLRHFEAVFMSRGGIQDRPFLVFRMNNFTKRKLLTKLNIYDSVQKRTDSLVRENKTFAETCMVAMLNRNCHGVIGENCFGEPVEINRLPGLFDELRQKRGADKNPKPINTLTRFFDEISPEMQPKFLAAVGIRTMKQRHGLHDYEQTLPTPQDIGTLLNTGRAEQSDDLVRTPGDIPVGDVLRGHGYAQKRFVSGASVSAPSANHGSSLIGRQQRTTVRESNGSGLATAVAALGLGSSSQPVPSVKRELTSLTSRLSSSQKSTRIEPPETVELFDDDEDDNSTPPAELSAKRKKEEIGQGTKLLYYGGVTLTVDDMKGLWFDEMANDSIIDLTIQYIRNHYAQLHIREKTHIFSCFFFKRLIQDLLAGCFKRGGEVKRFQAIEKNYRTIVHKWTKKVNLFSKDYLLIPVVDDLHWYLAIVVRPYMAVVPPGQETSNEDVAYTRTLGATRPEGQPPDTFVIMLDSLIDSNDYKRQCILDIVRDYLELEFSNKKEVHKLKGTFERTRLGILRPKRVPQQTNFTDCGFFTVKFAENFLTRPPENLSTDMYWSDWYEDTKLSLPYQKDLIYLRIKSLCPKELWDSFEAYNEEMKAKRDPRKIHDEMIHMARRRRCHSVVSRLELPVRHVSRSHSEPPSLDIVPASHFH